MTKKRKKYWIESRKCYRKRKIIAGEEHILEGKTLDDVDAQIDELERMHKEGVILNDDTTLFEFAQEWYPVKIAGLKHKSASVYKNAINVHIIPYFKDMKIKDIKKFHVKKFMAGLADLSKSMQKKNLGTLNQIMKEAKENKMIIENPCENIKARGYESRIKTPLTKTQQEELTIAVKFKRCMLFVLLCLYAGLRREEALGLKWGNVHLDEILYIDVRSTVTFKKGRPILSEILKSAAAYRSIPIPPVLSDALQEKKKEATSIMVIPAVKTGGAMSESAFQRMWEIVVGHTDKVVKRDKDGKAVKGKDGKSIKVKKEYPGVIDFHTEPHILRHTYITELCASGMDIKKIQYLAGHADVRMTLKIYAHVTENTPQELSGKIIEHFSKGASVSNKPDTKAIIR